MPEPRSLQLFAPLVGCWPDRIPDVFERLGPLLADAGFDVQAVSTRRRSIPRAVDLVTTAARRRPDVAIVHLYSGRAAHVEDLVARLQRVRAKRLVGLLAGGGFPSFETRKPSLVRRLLGRFDDLVAPSGYLAEWAGSIGKGPVEVIPNPLDIGAYPFRLRTVVVPRLLWMRAYHEIYDPFTAIAVVDRLRQVLPQVHLTMAGPDKGQQAAVISAVERRGLVEHIDVRGFVTGAEKAHLLSVCDVFLNTPVLDNRPVSVIEAAASGMCLVSTDAGGLPHLIRHETDGLLTPVGDADALATAVVRLVDDPELVRGLSVSGRRMAEAGEPPRVQTRWVELLGGP